MASECLGCGKIAPIDWETGYDDAYCRDCTTAACEGVSPDLAFHQAMFEQDQARRRNASTLVSTAAEIAADRGFTTAEIHALIDHALDIRETERRR